MDTYGFTTTTDDRFFDRVIEEADPDTNFIIIKARNTVTGDGDNTAIILVRKAVFVLALAIPEEKFAGRTLVAWVEEIVNDAADAIESEQEFDLWTAVVVEGEGVAAELDAIRHQIRRINNVLDRRIVRVEVESY